MKKFLIVFVLLLTVSWMNARDISGDWAIFIPLLEIPI